MTARDVLFVVFALISLVCAVHALRRPGPLWKRLMWSVIVFLPMLGPLLYGSLYETLDAHTDEITGPA